MRFTTGGFHCAPGNNNLKRITGVIARTVLDVFEGKSR